MPPSAIKLHQEVGKLLAEEGGVIIPMFVHQVLALRKGCTGYTPTRAELQPQLRGSQLQQVG